MQKIVDKHGITHVVIPRTVWQQLTERASLVCGGDGWSSWRLGNSLLSQENGVYTACPNYFLMAAS